jgi:hypothetical protein
MPLLTREAILAANDLKFEDVPVPEWGGDVRVLELTAAQRDKLEALSTDIKVENGKAEASVDLNKMLEDSFRARLAAWSVVDENNKRIFTDADMAALGAKSSSALQRVYNVAMRLSAFTPEDVEELVGKSAAAQSGDSPSDSASPSSDSTLT